MRFCQYHTCISKRSLRKNRNRFRIHIAEVFHVHQKENRKDAFLSNPVASATDCTGITQKIPYTDEEAESYCDIADVPVTALDGAEKYKKAK